MRADRLAMTTNGATLRLLADRLRRGRAAADQHQPRHARPRAVRRDDPARRAGPRARRHRRRASAAGFDPVKINTVVQRGRERRRDRRPRRVRPRARASRSASSSSCRSTPTAAWADARRRRPGRDRRPHRRRVPARAGAGAGRARRPTAGATATGGGTVGVIASVTEPFCGDCDRVRLTADGQFRNCLFATDEIDLRAAMLRAAESDDDAGRRDRGRGRPPSGPGTSIDQVDFVRPARSMSQIGG